MAFDALVPVTARRLLPWVKRFLKLLFAYKLYRVWYPRKVKSAKGAHVLVTGAGGGLGACICKEFAKRGAAKLVLWDINQEALDKVAEELRRNTGRYPALKEVKTQVVNLAAREDIYKASTLALESVGGRMDIVVNNAGMLTGQNFLDTPDKKIELTFAVNTFAHMYVTKAFLPGMLQRTDGSSAAFLNIASMASFMGAAQMADYSASKFAARGFAESLAAELKQLGQWGKCKVCCICPAHMATKLFKGFHIDGNIAMTPEFVAGKVVDAYESEQELVTLPRHLAPSIPLIGLLQSLCFFNIPLIRPKKSPLANFDRTQADAILKKMDT